MKTKQIHFFEDKRITISPSKSEENEPKEPAARVQKFAFCLCECLGVERQKE
jgi:hypothetical protein